MTRMIEIISRDQCRELGVRWTDEWFRQMEAAGKFPRRVRLGDNTIGYVKSEVQAWLAARVAERGRERRPREVEIDEDARGAR